jgi:hypothetical protein
MKKGKFIIAFLILTAVVAFRPAKYWILKATLKSTATTCKTYTSFNSCESAGKQLKKDGKIVDFYCEPDNEPCGKR